MGIALSPARNPKHLSTSLFSTSITITVRLSLLMGISMRMSQTPQRDQEEPVSSGRVQFSFLRNHGNNFPKEEGLL